MNMGRKLRIKIAYNGYGLAMWRNSCCFCPEPLPISKVKVQIKLQKLNRIPSARTEVE
jgi:hypothetical protein